MNKINNWIPYQPIAVDQAAVKKPPVKHTEDSHFSYVLNQKVFKNNPVKFSTHAQKRLQERNITLGPGDLAKINSAVERAANKGSRESLVLYGDIALVASVKNRTVVTAMRAGDKDGHVFTNIDSTVIIPK